MSLTVKAKRGKTMVIYYHWYHGTQYRRVWWRINRPIGEPHVIDIPIKYEPPVDTVGEMLDRAQAIVEQAVLKALGLKSDAKRETRVFPVYAKGRVIISHRYEMEIYRR